MNWRFTAAVALALAAVLPAGCDKKAEAPKEAPPSVTVSRPTQQPVIEYVETTGSVTASRTVDLVARVLGYLQTVSFEDGSNVEAGKLLMVIEPDQYEQQLKLNQAELLMAQSEYDRQNEMVKQNATAAANVEKWRCQRDQASAQVELAKLNLSYTRITAPFNGRIGRRLIDPGNLVGPGTVTRLATIEQTKPIYVYFSLNERDLLRLLDMMRKAGYTPKSAVGETPVFAGMQNEEGYPHKGLFDFADTAISTSTGALQMRAVYKNEDLTLIPGAFARVRIPITDPTPMLVIPSAAIGNDQEGDYVLIVGEGDVVSRRSIVRGPAVGKGGCAIREGLKADDRVIVKGILNAKPGEKVTPVVAAPESPAPAAATPAASAASPVAPAASPAAPATTPVAPAATPAAPAPAKPVR